MSNNTTISLIDKLNLDSLSSLSVNLPASILLSVMGFLGFLLNLLSLYVIGKSSNLHTKCYFLIANLCFGDVLLSGSYFATGMKRLLRLSYQIPETASQVTCMLEMFLSFFSQEASQNFAFSICIDRILAIFLPNWYRLLSVSYTILLASFTWAVCLVFSGFAFLNTSNSKLVSNCVLSTITPDSFYNFQNNFNIIVSTLTMIGYIFVLGRRKLKLKLKMKQNDKQRSEMEHRITLTLGAIVLVGFITHVLWSIAFAAFASLEPKIRNNVTPLFRNLPLISSIANPLIYFCRSSEFRAATLNTFKSKSNSTVFIISAESELKKSSDHLTK